MENLIIFVILAAIGALLQGMKEWLSKKASSSTPVPGTPEDEAEKAEKIRRFMEALGLPEGAAPPQPPLQAGEQQRAPQREEEEPPPLMVPQAPRQHPMGPGPRPWATTSRKAQQEEEKAGQSYEERMKARRRQLEKLKEARAQQKETVPAASRQPEQAVLPVEPLFTPLVPEAPAPLSEVVTPESFLEPSRFNVKTAGASLGGESSTSKGKTLIEENSLDAALQKRLRDPKELRRAFILKEILGRPKALEGF